MGKSRIEKRSGRVFYRKHSLAKQWSSKIIVLGNLLLIPFGMQKSPYVQFLFFFVFLIIVNVGQVNLMNIKKFEDIQTQYQTN